MNNNATHQVAEQVALATLPTMPTEIVIRVHHHLDGRVASGALAALATELVARANRGNPVAVAWVAANLS